MGVTMNKKQFTTTLQPETIEKLKKISKIKGLSVGQLIDVITKKARI